jgi:DNA polymerase III alpha subunit
VVVGLMAIKNLSRSGAEAVITERTRGGEFTCPADSSRRVKISRDDIISMVAAGVFDRISGGNQERYRRGHC